MLTLSIHPPVPMNTRRKIYSSLLAILVAASPLSAQTAPAAAADAPVAPLGAAPARLSPHETINAHIGSGRTAPLVMIVYGRPYSKKQGTTEVRKIWGTLVPWGQVWRVGSDEATLFITQVDLDFNGTTVPAGAYTLFMLPVETGTSKLIINKRLGEWGIPYDDADQKGELARVDLKKDTISSSVDEFTMSLTNTAGATPPEGVIKMQWETTQYSIAFTVKK